MKKVFFTDCELKELESIKILGGNSNGNTVQNRCSNSRKGCGVGTSQIKCSNSSQCMCTVITIQENCPNQTCRP